jgi:hypothetical protein
MDGGLKKSVIALINPFGFLLNGVKISTAYVLKYIITTGSRSGDGYYFVKE